MWLVINYWVLRVQV